MNSQSFNKITGMFLLLPLLSLHADIVTVTFTEWSGHATETYPIVNSIDNEWFNNQFGITFEDVYSYYDPNDIIDQVGIANQEWLTGIKKTGTIYFTEGTEVVTFDYATLANNIMVSIYDGYDNLLSSFYRNESNQSISGTETLSGTDIRKLTFQNGGGTVSLSTLTFEYDGLTDGVNNNHVSTVPEPAATVLIGIGLVSTALLRRRRIV